MVSYTREDLRLSRECRPFNGVNGSNRMFSDVLKVVQVVMKEVTRGPARAMPRGQTRGTFEGKCMGYGPHTTNSKTTCSPFNPHINLFIPSM